MTAKFDLPGLFSALETWDHGLSEERASLVRSVLDESVPCYVFGRNDSSAFMAEHVPLAGVIDDFADPGTVWLDLPVLGSSKLPPNAVVLNAVLLARTQQGLARLRALRPQPPVLHYGDFVRCAPDRFPWLPVCRQARDVLKQRSDNFEGLLRLFADEASLKTFHDVFLFRMTLDPVFTQGYRYREEDQYFDLSIPLPQGSVFVDGGAYRGETTELFCKNYPEYGRVHLFEPNDLPLRDAKERLREHNNIHYYEYAVSDCYEEVSFDPTAASASRIDEGGTEVIKTMPIDDIEGPVDFIKLDIEGFETRALAGARRIITDNHPALAICVYHSADDFLDVPELILGMRNDYQVRLRHYTEGLCETVMYFTA